MTKPTGFLSVMADRQPTLVDDLDYFPTPPWAARAGGQLVKDLDPAAVSCWEPACGEGHMAWGLADHFAEVTATDVHDYGFGGVLDFLGEEASGAAWRGRFDWIITNPPFIDGEAFIVAALARARRGVAMLLRLSFMETVGRYPLLYGKHPVRLVAPFAERVPMTKGRWDPTASTATAYAWFVWVQPGVDVAIPDGLSIIRGIPPGRKAALSKPADRAKFGPPDPGAGPLFGGDNA